MPLELQNLQPFAQGGNRLCFIHPDHPDRCIKVRRPDFSLADKRKRKGFPKNLRPLSRFDDNLIEYKVMEKIDKHFDKGVYRYISRCFGFEKTDLGEGLVSELIKDANGHISHTLKQYIWDNGLTEECQMALEQFIEGWVRLRIPSTDLLLHNIVVQLNSEDKIERLVVIDGLGESKLLPVFLTPESLIAKKFDRRIRKLKGKISQLLSERGGDFPGYHGLLLRDSRNEG